MMQRYTLPAGHVSMLTGTQRVASGFHGRPSKEGMLHLSLF